MNIPRTDLDEVEHAWYQAQFLELESLGRLAVL